MNLLLRLFVFMLVANLASVSGAHAQAVYGTYTFNGTTDCLDENQVISVNNVASGTFTNFNRNNPPSLPCNDGTDNMLSSSGFASATKTLAITNDDYYIFYLTLNNGHTYQNQQLRVEFDYLRDATGPSSGMVQYSYNNEAFQDATGGSFSPTTSQQSVSATIPAPGTTTYNSLGIRVIAWGGLSSGILELDNVSLVNPLGDLPLPVEFAMFRLAPGAKGIELAWATSSETNNAGFEVYRASDEETSYRKISSYVSDKALAGLGTSAFGKTYRYSDEDETLRKGRIYRYKVVDIDFDGRRSEHPAKEILFQDLSEAYFSLSPLPASDVLHADFMLAESGPVQVEVFSTDGQRVFSEKQGEYAAGANRITLSTAGFAQGVYSIVIRSNDIIQTKHFVVVK